MSIVYNADEIFRIAVQIEKNGKKFYDTAAKFATNEGAQKLLSELSSWEEKHVTHFENLRSRFASTTETPFEGVDEAWEYMKAAADSHVFVENTDINSLVEHCRDSRDVLQLALRFEKDSVVFYATVKRLVPEGLGRREIDRIEEEEIKHVTLIQRQLQLL